MHRNSCYNGLLCNVMLYSTAVLVGFKGCDKTQTKLEKANRTVEVKTKEEQKQWSSLDKRDDALNMATPPLEEKISVLEAEQEELKKRYKEITDKMTKLAAPPLEEKISVLEAEQVLIKKFLQETVVALEELKKRDKEIIDRMDKVESDLQCEVGDDRPNDISLLQQFNQKLNEAKQSH